MLKYFLDRYSTQKMCHKAVDDFLPAFLPEWLLQA